MKELGLIGGLITEDAASRILEERRGASGLGDFLVIGELNSGEEGCLPISQLPFAGPRCVDLCPGILFHLENVYENKTSCRVILTREHPEDFHVRFGRSSPGA